MSLKLLLTLLLSLMAIVFLNGRHAPLDHHLGLDFGLHRRQSLFDVVVATYHTIRNHYLG